MTTHNSDNYIQDISKEERDLFIEGAIKKLKLSVERNINETTQAGLISSSGTSSYLPAKKILDDTMKLVFNSIDPHTLWMSQEETIEFNNHLNNNYHGIGILYNFNKEKNMIYLLRVFEGSPAAKAGLLPKDYIYAIDDKLLNNQQTSPEIINSIKGLDGTSVEYEILENNYVYVSLYSFINETSDKFKSIIKEADVNSRNGIILDLRSNPGGLINVVIEIISMFLGNHEIMSIKDSTTKQRTIIYSNNKTLIKSSLPIFILIDSFSAYAAEILSASLALNGRAVLMGNSSTFGKWSVQTYYDLKDGSTLNLTTHLFYGPYYSSYQGEGVAPDILVLPSQPVKFFKEKDYPNYIKTLRSYSFPRSPKITIKEEDCKRSSSLGIAEYNIIQKDDKLVSCALLYLEKNEIFNK